MELEMKRIIFSVLIVCFFTVSAFSEGQTQLVRYFSPGKVFSLLLPTDWKQTNKGKSFAVISRNENVSVNGSAFHTKPDMDLKKFADTRWKVIGEKQPFYKRIKGPYDLEMPGYKSVAADYEGVWPGTKGITHYFVVCTQAGDTLVSLAFTMTKDEFLRNGDFYSKLAKSLQLD
jgi:hypothetical protein